MANRKHILAGGGVAAIFLLLLSFPVWSAAQPAPSGALPPISQQLVREGDFAVRLLAALGLGTVEDEAEAESKLGEVGITPRNGWIADYPVTPDILGELRDSVGAAAENDAIPFDAEDARQKLDAVSAEFSLGIRPQVSASDQAPGAPPPQDYPNPTVINNYYQAEGPPIVTYYTPPPDYYYLYSWVPYPFWWTSFWFPGFFVLHDFHRPFHVDNRVSFVSNHFNDIRGHRVYRVDPLSRFNGRTYAGIGVRSSRGFISTGVARSQRTIFNAPRPQAAPGMRPLPGMRSSYRPSGTGARSSGAPRTFAPSARSPRSTSAPRGGTSRTFSGGAPGGAARSFTPPSRGGAPSGGGARGGAPAGGHDGGVRPR